MATEGLIISGLIEFGISLLNAWILAAEQAGLSKEQAIAVFPSIVTAFNVASAKPVDPVKE